MSALLSGLAELPIEILGPIHLFLPGQDAAKMEVARRVAAKSNRAFIDFVMHGPGQPTPTRPS